MKKYFLTLSLLTMLLPSSAFAISGACSYHNGVNCTASPNYDGNVICNDGWTNSSVKYVDTEECSDYINCTQTQYNDLLSKYGINNTKQQIIDLQNQISSITSQASIDIENVVTACAGECPQRVITANQQSIYNKAAAQITLLESQITSLKYTFNMYIDLVNGECKAMGYDRVQVVQMQRLLQHNQEIEAEKEKLLQEKATILAMQEVEQNKVLQPVVEEKPAIVRPKPEIKQVKNTTIPTSTTSTEKIQISTTTNYVEKVKIEPIKELKQPFFKRIFSFLKGLFR